MKTTFGNSFLGICLGVAALVVALALAFGIAHDATAEKPPTFIMGGPR